MSYGASSGTAKGKALRDPITGIKAPKNKAQKEAKGRKIKVHPHRGNLRAQTPPRKITHRKVT